MVGKIFFRYMLIFLAFSVPLNVDAGLRGWWTKHFVVHNPSEKKNNEIVAALGGLTVVVATLFTGFMLHLHQKKNEINRRLNGGKYYISDVDTISINKKIREEGSIDELRFELNRVRARGIDIKKVKDFFYRTFLGTAVLYNKREVVKLLIEEYDFLVNDWSEDWEGRIYSRFRRKPLAIAIECNNAEMVRFLIEECGASSEEWVIECCRSNGEVEMGGPLCEALKCYYSGECDFEIVRLLVEQYRCPLNVPVYKVVDANGKVIKCCLSLLFSLMHRDPAVIALLLKNGANPCLKLSSGVPGFQGIMTVFLKKFIGVCKRLDDQDHMKIFAGYFSMLSEDEQDQCIMKLIAYPGVSEADVDYVLTALCQYIPRLRDVVPNIVLRSLELAVNITPKDNVCKRPAETGAELLHRIADKQFERHKRDIDRELEHIKKIEKGVRKTFESELYPSGRAHAFLRYVPQDMADKTVSLLVHRACYKLSYKKLKKLIDLCPKDMIDRIVQSNNFSRSLGDGGYDIIDRLKQSSEVRDKAEYEKELYESSSNDGAATAHKLYGRFSNLLPILETLIARGAHPSKLSIEALRKACLKKDTGSFESPKVEATMRSAEQLLEGAKHYYYQNGDTLRSEGISCFEKGFSLAKASEALNWQ